MKISTQLIQSKHCQATYLSILCPLQAFDVCLGGYRTKHFLIRLGYAMPRHTNTADSSQATNELVQKPTLSLKSCSISITINSSKWTLANSAPKACSYFFTTAKESSKELIYIEFYKVLPTM